MQRLMGLRGIALAGLTMLSAGSAFAEIDLRNATVTGLENGMTVILLEDRNFPVASVQMLYTVGARNESFGSTGIAHFVEHMAFRDTENFPGTEVVSSIYARGGEWHGYTWTDETTYFATVPKEHLDLLLRIEAERMVRLEIPEDDMEAERGAVLAEMHSYENYPLSMLLDAVMYVSFIAHPYRNNTIGWESDIRNITHADVVDFYERHYKPANAVLAIVGDFESDDVLERVRELFGELPGGTPTPLPHTIEPRQGGERHVRLYGPVERQRFMMAWRAPSSNDPDYAAFLVLQEVLGSGSGVNFAQNDWGSPVEEGSVLYGAGADLTTWYPPSAQDYVFVVGGTVDAETAQGAVEGEITARLERVRRDPLDAASIDAAIEAVQDQLVYDVQTTEDAAHQLAFFAGLGALDTLLELPERVAAVTAADVQRVAREYLGPELRTVGWYVPERFAPVTAYEPATAAPEREVAASGPAPLDDEPVPAPVVRTLGGGLPAIVQHSDLSSSVQVQLVLRGGNLAAPGLAAGNPVAGHSSLAWHVRPYELRATLAKAGETLVRVEVAPRGGEIPSPDPGTRLAQAFGEIMAREEAAAVEPALVVVSGDVDEAETFALLEEFFGEIEAPEKGDPQSTRFEPGERELSIGHPIAQAQLGYIVPAPPPPRADAWRILLYVLSHGYEGRLGKEAISGRGLVYYIDSGYRSDGSDGWITLAVGVDPHKLEPLEALLGEELARLASDPPTAAEIEEAKAHLVGRAVSAAQSNAELAEALARDWIWYGELLDPEALGARLEGIERRDVLDVIDDFIEGTVIAVAE